MTPPTTSVLTATRNRPDYLAEAISSVRSQTASETWEHLVGDDGSEDPRVGEVLRAARERDPERVRTSFAPHRGDRPARIWNTLLRQAAGRYVAVLDDDNRWHPEFLERMVAPLAADPALDAVTCGRRFIDEAGRPSEKPECHRNLRTSLRALYRDNTVDGGAVLYRKSSLLGIGGFPEHLTACEDWYVVARLAQSGRMLHLVEALLLYREHGEARSGRALGLGVESAWDRVRAELFPEGPP